mmetsp:Transcript_49754/g.81790  ORF Transcript_49754/g.81790 Transcript_49754/m.81790 type:complete len:242 (+) Transcript_49754:131-856(+)
MVQSMTVNHHLPCESRWLVPHNSSPCNGIMPVSRHLIIGCTTLSATRSPALAVSEAGDDLEWVDVLMIRVVPGPQGTLHHCTQEALVKYKVLFEKVSVDLLTIQAGLTGTVGRRLRAAQVLQVTGVAGAPGFQVRGGLGRLSRDHRGDGGPIPGHRIRRIRVWAPQQHIRAAAGGDGRGATKAAGEVADVDTILGQEDHLTSNIEVQRLCQPPSIDHSKSRPFPRRHRDAGVHLTINQGLK